MHQFTFGHRYLGIARAWSRFCRGGSGAGLLFQPLKWAHQHFGADRAWVEYAKGRYVPLHWNDIIVYNLITNGLWEKEETRIVKSLASHCGVFFDVGVHCGYFSTLAAKAMPAGGHVYSFEPNPEMFDVAKRAFQRSRLDTIQLIPAAVSDDNGTATLFLNQADNRGKTSLYAKNTSKSGAVEVKTVRLDDFVVLNGIPSLDFLKVDTEGHEWFVIQGALETIKKFRPAILIELVPHLLAQSGHTVEDVFALLTPLGYEIKEELAFGNYLLQASAPQRSAEPDESVLLAASTTC